MNRYIIHLKDGKKLKQYYNSLEEIQSIYPECNIEIDEDKSFLKYIDKIKSISEPITDVLWKILYGVGYILYQQYMADGEYIDGCKYMRFDEHKHTIPILKTFSNPKDFYERFFDDDVLGENHGYKRMSKREFGKLKDKEKPVRFCKMDTVNWYVDGYGNFYFQDTINKNQIVNWEKFNGNDKAVLGRIWYGNCKYSCRWYNNMEEFMSEFKQTVKETPAYFAAPRYEIIKQGYDMLHPYDRRNTIRLPYYPIVKIPKNERNATKVALSWNKILRESEFKGEINILEKVIKKYWEYIDKKENV